MDLDEINATPSQSIHSLASLGGVRYRQTVFQARFWAVHKRARSHDVRTQTCSGCDLVPPTINLFEVSAQVAHAGHPVFNEQRQAQFGLRPSGVHACPTGPE